MSRRDPKQIILDAALSTFVELGFERATTEHIRARAGTSNGGLFHHFPSKDAIAEALYLRGIASYQEGLIVALDRGRSTRDARAAIKAAVRHHLTWVEANRDLAQFMYERGRPDWQPAHGAAIRKLNRSTAMHIRDWIAPLVAAGVVRDLSLTAIAACVAGPAHFVARRWLSGLIAARPTSFVDVLADAAWAALTPGKPRRPAAPSQRLSAAAAIEAAALEAASAACPATSHDDWTISHLTMTSLSQAALSQPGVPQVHPVRMQGDGCIALVDIDLLDADGSVTMRGHAVCLRHSATVAEPINSGNTGAAGAE
jgi:AcrR family transcriptional regulator